MGTVLLLFACFAVPVVVPAFRSVYGDHVLRIRLPEGWS
jgi:hypothetical protein